MNSRAIASKILMDVITHQRSLSGVLSLHLKDHPQRNLIQELSFGVLRWHPQLAEIAKNLLEKPLKTQDNDIYFLLLIGLYQLIYLQIPTAVAVSETVNAAKQINKTWATKLINGVLRNFLRNKDVILTQIESVPAAKYAHPEWLIATIQQAWPEHWQQILTANNQRPPLSLRVNECKISRENYLKKLALNNLSALVSPYASAGIVLTNPIPVAQLPGFYEGEVSVQDCASQLAASLLQPKPGQRILDACAAPGGKTTAILELEPEITELVALDVDAQRVEKITENLRRLALLKANTKLLVGDAADPTQWWDSHLFDRILLDAPCSATGVIRRHPDIKVLRRPTDINQLAKMQLSILTALWPLLNSGGLLLYSTCSIFPAENNLLIADFLQTHPDASEYKITASWGKERSVGRQILPGEDNMDGFYYALLQKK